MVLVAVSAAHSHKASALAVPTERVRLQAFTVKLPENGVVMFPTTVTVPTLVGGNIHTMYAKAGDHVVAGQLLATIDNPSLEYQAAGSQADYDSSVANITTSRINEQNARVQYQGQVDTAKSNLSEAKRIYDADAALLADHAIARTQVDADKAKVVQAQVAYDQALSQLRLGAVSGFGQNSVKFAQAAAEKSRIINEQNQQQLGFTRITAPLTGVVQTVATQSSDALRSLQAGDPVNAGQSLFTVASSEGYIVKAEVDEQDVIDVKLGQRVLVTGQDFPDQKIPGHVATIAPVAVKSVDATSTAKQVLTTIALDRSPSFLKDGMSADVDILTTDIPHALTVPNDAIVKESGKSPYVFVVVDGKAKKRVVKLGRTGDASTIVTSGLSIGDVIVKASVPGLSDAAAVTSLPSPSPTPKT